ncbi:MAG: coproporphyrinogen-III oxidase family protein [Candidatus Gracilibacteria bacterium]|nr:coproporphyrinogen-III oxidase family protein [Candidatus Gracilibacteria bacterium]
MYCYIHIPFCESKCLYCRFASIGSLNQALIKKYLSHLLKNIQNFKNSDFLNSIYFGGGTPSILKEVDLDLVIKTLKGKFLFKKDIEITLETTSKNITLENLNTWHKLGINRISIGIQTLNNKTLAEIGRDNKNIILNGLENLKTSKIKNISIDFIIGLPYVESGEILKDIKYILKNYDFIKHISVYMLEDYYEIIEEKSGFEKIVYPNNWRNLGIKEENYLQEYLQIKNYLEKNRFIRYELSNFAKTGFECKHNKSYWNHSEVVSFGLGSHSFLNGVRYAYKDDFLGYYALKLDYKEKLTKEEIFLEKIMFGLRTNGLKKDIYSKLNQEKLEEFIKTGYLEFQDKILKITDKGIALIDKIILELI